MSGQAVMLDLHANIESVAGHTGVICWFCTADRQQLQRASCRGSTKLFKAFSEYFALATVFEWLLSKQVQQVLRTWKVAPSGEKSKTVDLSGVMSRMCAKFRNFHLRINKALGIFRKR